MLAAFRPVEMSLANEGRLRIDGACFCLSRSRERDAFLSLCRPHVRNYKKILKPAADCVKNGDTVLFHCLHGHKRSPVLLQAQAQSVNVLSAAFRGACGELLSDVPTAKLCKGSQGSPGTQAYVAVASIFNIVVCLL